MRKWKIEVNGKRNKRRLLPVERQGENEENEDNLYVCIAMALVVFGIQSMAA